MADEEAEGTRDLLTAGRHLIAAGEFDLACRIFERAMQRAPRQTQSHLELANALYMSQARQESLQVLARAASTCDANRLVFFNLAQVARELGHAQHERSALQALLELERGTPEQQFRLAELLDRAGEGEQALPHYRAAVEGAARNPVHHIHLGYALLRQGAWREAWPEMAWYWREEGLALFSPWGLLCSTPVLRHASEAVGKSILVTGWGGGGDIIQFSRYAHRLLAAGASRVTLHATHNVSFFARNRWGLPAVTHLPRDLIGLVNRYDAWVSNAALPGLFDVTAADCKAEPAYFHADPGKLAYWRARLGHVACAQSLKVGIAWSGDPTNLYEHNRSIPTAQLLPLLRVPGVQWYVIQKNEGNAQLASSNLPGVHDWSADFHDFDDTAALVAQLDLVISVDSFAAHLAGSLGVPCWLLLSAAGDWRWGVPGKTTLWYDSLRLLRQRQLNEWTETLERVAQALATHAPDRSFLNLRSDL